MITSLTKVALQGNWIDYQMQIKDQIKLMFDKIQKEKMPESQQSCSSFRFSGELEPNEGLYRSQAVRYFCFSGARYNVLLFLKCLSSAITITIANISLTI